MPHNASSAPGSSPPSLTALQSLWSFLTCGWGGHDKVGALDDAEELTALGHHLAALPVDVRVGKLLLLGASFGCLDPILTIAAALSYKSPFASSQV